MKVRPCSNVSLSNKFNVRLLQVRISFWWGVEGAGGGGGGVYTLEMSDRKRD